MEEEDKEIEDAEHYLFDHPSTVNTNGLWSSQMEESLDVNPTLISIGLYLLISNN